MAFSFFLAMKLFPTLLKQCDSSLKRESKLTLQFRHVMSVQPTLNTRKVKTVPSRADRHQQKPNEDVTEFTFFSGFKAFQNEKHIPSLERTLPIIKPLKADRVRLHMFE